MCLGTVSEKKDRDKVGLNAAWDSFGGKSAEGEVRGQRRGVGMYARAGEEEGRGAAGAGEERETEGGEALWSTRRATWLNLPEEQADLKD